MSKESWDAWVCYTAINMEINLCMREQRFLHTKMSYKEIDEGFEMQDKIVKEIISQLI